MTVKRVLTFFGLAVIGIAVWMILKPTDWQNWMGFSHKAYFQTGQNYALYSGLLPCMLTAAGMSTIIVGLWHSVNCHFDGCPKIGRHKINGTPWCDEHHETARKHRSVEDLLTELLATNYSILEILKVTSGEPS